MRNLSALALVVVGVVVVGGIGCPSAATPDADPTDELNTTLSFDATTNTLSLTDKAATLTADLSSLAGDDADADPTNEVVSEITLDGTELNIREGGNTFSADLASLRTPPQSISYDDVTNVLTLSGAAPVQLPDPQTLTYDAAAAELSLTRGNTIALPIPKRIFLVSPVGSAVENGNALLAVHAAITATASTPALLRIEPGDYDLGVQTLEMRPFIDVEGSGATRTTLAGDDFDADGGVAVVFVPAGVNNSTLRNVHLRPIGGAIANFGVSWSGDAGRLENVAVDGDVSITGALNIESSRISGSLRVEPQQPSTSVSTVRNSTIAGTVVIIQLSTGVRINIANTLVGGVIQGVARAQCVGAFNAVFEPLNDRCE